MCLKIFWIEVSNSPNQISLFPFCKQKLIILTFNDSSNDFLKCLMPAAIDVCFCLFLVTVNLAFTLRISQRIQTLSCRLN